MPDVAQDPVALAVELLNPRRHDLERDQLDQVEALAEYDAADHARERRLRERHTAALRRPRQPAQATRALGDLMAHRRAAAARRARVAAREAMVPSLLDQVVEAIESSSGSGHRTAAGAHRSPIGLAAAALVGDVERVVGHGPRRRLCAAVWAWVRAGLGPDTVDGTTAQLAAWVARAHAVVDPPRPVELAAACPQCRARTVRTPDDAGEAVRRPALEIDRVSGMVTCARCRAQWGPELWEFLARVLADDPGPVGGDGADLEGAVVSDPTPLVGTRRVRRRGVAGSADLTPATGSGDHPAREG